MAFPERPRRLTLLAAALLLCPPARARSAQGGRGSALVRREVLAVDSRGQLSGGAAQGGTTAGLEEKQAWTGGRPTASVSSRSGARPQRAPGGSMQRAGGEEGVGNEEGPALEAKAQVQLTPECQSLLKNIDKLPDYTSVTVGELKECIKALEASTHIANNSAIVVRHELKDVKRRERFAKGQLKRARKKEEEALNKSQRAIKDTEKAEKEMKVAKQLKDKALVEKSCTMHLSKQVKMDIYIYIYIYVSDWLINVPEGATIQYQKNGTSAHRCPNSIACPHSVVELNVDPRSKAADNCETLRAEAQCQEGYNSTTPGCASCTIGFGRSNADPFICEQCGHQILQWLAWLGVPIMLYAASLRSAFDAARRGASAAFSNDALKILLAFTSASALVASTIDATPVFRRMPDGVRGVLSMGIHASGGDATAFASSLDCLVNGGEQQIGPLSVVGLVFAQAAIAMLLAMTAQLIQWFRAKYTPGSLMVCYIVATNQFVPLITAACARSLPCYHTQVHPDDPLAPAESWLSHESLASCSGRARYSMITVPLASGAIVAGPLLWIFLIRNSVHDHAMKFITGSHTEGRQSWEAFRLTKTTVLAVTATLAPTTYSPSSKLAMALFTMTVFLGAHMRLRPYKYQKLNDAEGLSLLFTCCSLICASVLATDAWSSTQEMQAVVLFLSAGFLLAAFVYLVRFYARAKYHELFSEEEEEEEDHAEDAKGETADAAERGKPPAEGSAPSAGVVEEGGGRRSSDDGSRGDEPKESPPQAEVPKRRS
ncbi:unnamed protein product [Prorocentrum cordatum]|uniref:Uncharacterized protein n=1 Tax=Prorocentrum cordatum TaxID=2364126 RepID=A0ABN9WP86_9DINO|nr:unnamed protein product [Polarella glacialis]